MLQQHCKVNIIFPLEAATWRLQKDGQIAQKDRVCLRFA